MCDGRIDAEPTALRAWRWAGQEQSYDTRFTHLVIARADQESEVGVQVLVVVAYWALVLLLIIHRHHHLTLQE